MSMKPNANFSIKIMKNGKKKIKLMFNDRSRTKQSMKDQCDINTIIAKYQKSKTLTHVNNIQGHFGDFTNVTDYQSACLAVQNAEDNFLQLPAMVRKKFENDPSQLLAFIADDKNYSEAQELGLIPKESRQHASLLKGDSKNSPQGGTIEPEGGASQGASAGGSTEGAGA
jgi:phage internal scaffolding protein